MMKPNFLGWGRKKRKCSNGCGSLDLRLSKCLEGLRDGSAGVSWFSSLLGLRNDSAGVSWFNSLVGCLVDLFVKPGVTLGSCWLHAWLSPSSSS